MVSDCGGVFLLTFFVDLLLILGAEKLCGGAVQLGRSVLAALYGGIHAGIGMIPRFSVVAQPFGWILGVGLIGLVAFGFSHDILRKCTLFFILQMALSGIVMGTGGRDTRSVLLSAVGVFALCMVTVCSRLDRQLYVPVELFYKGKRMEVTALRDTGNTLRDPISGRPVLVLSADLARELIGLTDQQLRQPVQTVGLLPGLRLIPYRSVGSTGLLLALRLQNVRIGSWRGSSVVAFSPEVFSSDGVYQALTGGVI